MTKQSSEKQKWYGTTCLLTRYHWQWFKGHLEQESSKIAEWRPLTKTQLYIYKHKHKHRDKVSLTMVQRFFGARIVQNWRSCLKLLYAKGGLLMKYTCPTINTNTNTWKMVHGHRGKSCPKLKRILLLSMEHARCWPMFWQFGNWSRACWKSVWIQIGNSCSDFSPCLLSLINRRHPIEPLFT